MIHSLSLSVLPCTLGAIKCAHLRQTYRSTSSVPYGGSRIYLCVAWMSQDAPSPRWPPVLMGKWRV